MTSQVRRLPPAARKKARLIGYSISLAGLVLTAVLALLIGWRAVYVTWIPVAAGPAVEWALFLNRRVTGDDRPPGTETNE